MYRINLHPEYFANRRRARQRTLHAGLLSGLVGAATLLVALLYLSAALLGDQAGQLRASVRRLETALGTRSADAADLDTSRELFRRRLQRIDWTPKLAALSQRIDSGLKLNEVTGRIASKGKGAEMEIAGRLRSETRDTEAVLQFVDLLGNDPRITDDLPLVRLATIEWAGGGRFQVECQPVEPREES